MSIASLPLDVQQKVFEGLDVDETLGVRAGFWPNLTNVPPTEKEKDFIKKFHSMPVASRLEYRARFIPILHVVKPHQEEADFIYNGFKALPITRQDSMKPALEWLVEQQRAARKERQAKDPRHLKKQDAKAKRARIKWNGQEVVPTKMSLNWTTMQQ